MLQVDHFHFTIHGLCTLAANYLQKMTAEKYNDFAQRMHIENKLDE